MEAIWKQATRLSKQVAWQQLAVLKQFGAYWGSDVLADGAEVQQHQKLEKLYISTHATKLRGSFFWRGFMTGRGSIEPPEDIEIKSPNSPPKKTYIHAAHEK